MTDVANWYGPRDKIREQDGEIKKARKAVKDWKKAYKKNKAQGLKSPDSRAVRLSKQKLLSEQFGIQGRQSTIYVAVWEFKPLTLIQRIRLSSVQDVVRISVKEKAHIMKRLSVQIVEK